jgi:malic enzyme
MSSRYKQQAPGYHAGQKQAETGTQITQPCITQHDLSLAYNMDTVVFGRDYMIPKPLDPRLIHTIPAAVSKAPIGSGVARKFPTDIEHRQAV